MDYKAKLQTNNTELANNNIDLQAILNTINTLPEADGGGTDTSDATVTSADILNGKTAYGADGKLTGTFSLDEEITVQDTVIAQIRTALEGKAIATPILQSKTITPNDNIQTVSPDSGYDGLSKVTVNAIPDTYVQPAVTQAATTYTPTTSNQTIAVGTYCTGDQIIKGDENLIAENIKSGVSIFGVTGSHEGSSEGTNGGQHTVSVQTDRSGSSIQCFYLSNGQLCFDTVAGIFQFAEQDFLVDSGTYFIVITSEYYSSVPSGWAEWYNNGNGICYFSKLITEDSSYSE